MVTTFLTLYTSLFDQGLPELLGLQLFPRFYIKRNLAHYSRKLPVLIDIFRSGSHTPVDVTAGVGGQQPTHLDGGRDKWILYELSL